MSATRSLLAVVAFALAPACGGGGGGGSGTVIIETDPVDDTVADGQALGDARADQSLDELIGNDYLVQIGLTATILASINDGAVAEADIAAQIVDGPDVFAFANDEIIDHEDANVELDAVLRFYGVGYFPSDTADDIAASASANVAAIRNSGDPDFTYIESQVITHASAQVLLDQLYDVVGPGELGNYILDMRTMTGVHLSDSTNILSTFY